MERLVDSNYTLKVILVKRNYIKNFTLTERVIHEFTTNEEQHFNKHFMYITKKLNNHKVKKSIYNRPNCERVTITLYIRKWVNL